MFSVHWPDPWGTWTRWASTFGTHGELLSVVPTENWQWIAGEFKVLKCLKNASFFGEVLPEAWPPRIIPRDDQQVFPVFHRVFSVKVKWQKVGCTVAPLEIKWFVDICGSSRWSICYCFSMDDIPPLKTPAISEEAWPTISEARHVVRCLLITLQGVDSLLATHWELL